MLSQVRLKNQSISHTPSSMIDNSFSFATGMMSYAASNQRNGFLLAVVHIVNRDWSELVKLYVRLGFIPEGIDPRPIEKALEDALPDILSADISELNFKNVINELGDIM